jgi:RNA polymerase sigma factor (TIGR02999 family)
MQNSSRNEITLLLSKLQKGDRQVVDKLMPLVYSELRRLASKYLSREYEKRTIQTTELVHEAYIKLIGNVNISWQNRAHFFGIAANSMRQILVDYARKRLAEKRGGSFTRVSLFEGILVFDETDEKIIALDEALAKLSEIDSRLSRIVELRFFTGLTIEETAEVMQISSSTVKREWNIAKAWLYREIENTA